MGTRASSSNSPSDWANGLDTGILELVSIRLDSPYVPVGLHLSSTCSAWRAAAGQTSTKSLTWDSSQLPCDADFDLGRWGASFKSWLLKAGPLLDTLVLEGNDRLAPRLASKVACAAVEEVAQAAAAAGNPLPLQQLQLPAALPWRPQSMQAASLVAALPHLRRLSLPVSTWTEGDSPPAGSLPLHRARLLAALGDLHHLTSLEVKLVQGPHGGEDWEAAAHWDALLKAVPKQLQHLAVWLAEDVNRRLELDNRLEHVWEDLAALPHLKQLQLGAVWMEDLSELAALPSLTSLGLQWQDHNWQPLLAVKGVLRELEVPYLSTKEDVELLQQLTCLTSLRLRSGQLYQFKAVPQQVASGLQRLYWALEAGPNTNKVATFRLDHCSSSNLRELQLWGWCWMGEPGAAEAVQQLTGLTSFSLLTRRAAKAPYADMGAWRALLPMQHLKQLCCLALPASLLATGGAWLGGLPHLTSLRLLVEWSAPWQVEEVQRRVFGEAAASAQVVSNLRSCWAGLKVLEVELTLSYLKARGKQGAEEVVPGMRALLRRELPGVHVLLTWRVEWDVEEREMHVDYGLSGRTDSEGSEEWHSDDSDEWQ